MADREITEFLADVVGVVEANSFERLCLWQEHHTRRLWLDRNDGLLETVGYVDGMPVCLSLLTSKIDGYKVLFIDATSQVVDHRLIDKWLTDTLPKSAFKSGGEPINKTDAMNFHNVFPRVAVTQEINAMTDKLLPCPFCGEQPKVLKSTGEILCGGQECFGPVTTADNVEDSTVQWNKRTTSAEIDRLREALHNITLDGPIWRAQRIAKEALAPLTQDKRHD